MAAGRAQEGPMRPKNPHRPGGTKFIHKLGPNNSATWEPVYVFLTQMFASTRSEERRVGKEGRSRWSPDH